MSMRDRIAASLASRGRGTAQLMAPLPTMAPLGAPPAPPRQANSLLPIPPEIASPQNPAMVPDLMQRYYERIPDPPGSPFARALADYQRRQG